MHSIYCAGCARLYASFSNASELQQGSERGDLSLVLDAGSAPGRHGLQQDVGIWPCDDDAVSHEYRSGYQQFTAPAKAW